MSNDYNETQVQATLDILLDIFQKYNVEYRMLGSVVSAAMIGRQHRRLGDIDVIIDREKHPLVLKDLLKHGYMQAPGMFAFARKYLALETLVHPNLVSVGYFYGQWQHDSSFKIGNRWINMCIDAHAVRKEEYHLDAYTFDGLPRAIIANGILASQKNPKREKELLMLREKNIKAASNDYIHIRCMGLLCDWLYHFSMWSLNVIGKLRVNRGLPFDPWRSQIR